MSSKTRGIVVYLALSFAGTWLWLLVAHRVMGLSALNPLLQLPGFCVPAIAAFVVRRWVTREGFADAGLRLRLKTAWRYYLLAWVGPLAIAAVPMALAAVLGLWRPDLTPLDEIVEGVPGWAAVLALMLALPVLTPLYWGEEFGWTSYLRPRLFGGRMAPSVIITGLVWASWHYPLAFIGYVEFSRLFLGLLVWTLSFQCQEAILAWLFVRSGTIWTASLAHAGNNMVLFLLTGQVLGSGDDGLGTVAVTLLTMIPLAGLSLWIARRPNCAVAYESPQ